MNQAIAQSISIVFFGYFSLAYAQTDVYEKLSVYGFSHHTEIESFCFDSMAKENIGKTSVMSLISSQIDESLKRINSCASAFEELTPYTENWKKTLNNSIINCSAITGTEVEEMAEAAFYPPNKTLYVGVHSFFSNWIQKGLGANTFIHEYFHGALANNMNHHNELEVVQSSYCASVFNVDRVYLLEKLCSIKETRNGAILETPMVLYNDIKKCGLELGCENIFNGTYNDLDAEKLELLGSLDLTQENARTLCQKIYGHNQAYMAYLKNSSKKLPPIFADLKQKIKVDYQTIFDSQVASELDKVWGPWGVSSDLLSKTAIILGQMPTETQQLELKNFSIKNFLLLASHFYPQVTLNLQKIMNTLELLKNNPATSEINRQQFRDIYQDWLLNLTRIEALVTQHHDNELAPFFLLIHGINSTDYKNLNYNSEHSYPSYIKAMHSTELLDALKLNFNTNFINSPHFEETFMGLRQIDEAPKLLRVN